MRTPSEESSRVRARRWPRRLAWAAGGLLTVLGLAAATLDFWLPPLAEKWLGDELRFSTRFTQAGRHVEWEGVAWKDEVTGLRVDAARLRVSSPWRILLDGRLSAEAEGWTLTIPPSRSEEDTSGPDGTWEKWLPFARELGRRMEARIGELDLRTGRARVRGEEILVDKVEVHRGQIRALAQARGQSVELEAWPAETRFDFDWLEGEVRVSGTFTDTGAKADLRWRENEARVEAAFAAGEWLPARFEIVGDNWRVAPEVLGLGDSYEEVSGGFAIRGAGAKARLSAEARARPAATGLPELRLEVAGEAEPDRARVDRLWIEAPQARARLSAPIEWRRGAGWSGEGEPVFAWEADLGALSGGFVRGKTEGAARWIAGAEGARVRWDARGSGLAWRHIEGLKLALRGESDAGATSIAEATLRAADGSTASGRGRITHARRELEGLVVEADLRETLLRPWLPEAARFEALRLELRGSGAWPRLDAQGTARVVRGEYSGWGADELVVSGELRGGAETKVEFNARRGGAALTGFAAGHLQKGMLGGLTLRRGDGRELGSRGFAGGSWAEGNRGFGFHLGNDHGEELHLIWSEKQRSVLRIRKLDTSWLADWRTGEALPLVAVREMDAEALLDAAGLLTGKLAFDIGGKTRGGVEAWARGAAALGEGGARVDRFEAGQGEARLAEGAGEIPWRLRRAGKWSAEAVEGAGWNLRLESRAGADWWEELAKAANLSLEEPTASLVVEGAAEIPRARLDLAAARVVLRGEGLPEGGLELSGLRAEAELVREALELRRLEAEIDRQRIEVGGRLALAEGDWSRLRARPYLWLRDHAEARVRVPGAEVAAVARYLPTLLAPQGVLEADLRLAPGARLDGTLALRGAATRPLGDFGVLQEMELALVFAGMEVRIDRMRAMAGGQELRISGGARRTPGRMPALDLAVRAERLPLLRKSGLLLRGDLDLSVRTDGDGRTKLGGEVRLRDSLFLADIRPLLRPGGGGGRSPAAVRARPPYFSVEAAPLADWELGLRVGGEEFLRLRTPVFEGVGSARFDLAGTLREPRAVGEFWVERGNILFPFASFAVQQGAVRLRASDPYTPTLDFRATGRRLGYELRLELGGTADAPQLQLSSSPPLDSERVLLMVTAGAAPMEGAEAASRTQRLAAVGAYVGRDLLRTLGVGGADEERLTVSSGEKISRAGRETYGFEFKLNERWLLTGEYDEFDAYNVGVKRRFGPGVAAERERAAREKEADDGR